MTEATGYPVQLDQTSAESSDVTGVTYQVSALLLEQWYWWRVSSCNVDQVCGGPSLARRFFTGSDEVERYYYLTDHLGSVRATLNEDGAVVHYDDYYPFGMPMPGRSMETPEAPRERFTGYEMETDIDPDFKAVYYAGARYYDGLLGRWGVVDPLAEHPNQIDKSPYQYAWNNPILLNDPDGRCPGCKWLTRKISDGIEALGFEKTATAFRTYTEAFPDPLVDTVDFFTDVAEGDYASAGKSVDPTGISSIPDQIETAQAALDGDGNAQVEVVVGVVLLAVARKAGKAGRAKNKLGPDPKAQGAHTTFKTDKQGNITGHSTWEQNSRNPSGFDLKQRTDVTGKPHFNKKTGQQVPTPHTHGKDIPGGARPARPDEIPRKKGS